MAVEIERKFLVAPHKLPQLNQGKVIRQGYISIQPHGVVRVRTLGEEAYLTVKSATQGISRSEFEYAIPVTDALEMLNHICVSPQIEKTRYLVVVGAHTWEIDVFDGDNRGLIVAEIELASEDESFIPPRWITKEVSDDPKYRNSNLIQKPYKSWPQEI